MSRASDPLVRPAATDPARPNRAHRVGRLLAEVGPPFVVAVVLLPWVIAHGQAWPWVPSTIDLQVYVYAVHDLLAGRDIYATTTPGWNLYFIYPPVAALLMVPLAFGPYWTWQLLWTLGLVGAQQSVLRRCGLPRGWRLGLIGAAVVLAVEPIRTTLGYGQINTFLMAMVIADLLPDRPGERRWLPQGLLIGLAAALKLTPALFIVFAWVIGKRRVAGVATLSFVAWTALGAVLQWLATVAFWGGLAGGNTRTAGPIYTGNQSLLGVFARLGDDSSRLTTLIGLGVAGLVALLGTLVAASWWASGQRVFAVALVGLCTCLASPLSWTHHYVWILPLGAAVLVERGLPRWVRVLGGAWVVWVSVCLPLALLPYGYDQERSFTPLQEFVANLGPLLGVALVVGLGIRWLRRRAPTVAARS